MRAFTKAVLSEDGRPSSKRVITFILLIAFLFMVIVNMFTGKAPIPEIRQELFYAFSGALGTVFGSNVINAWKEVKTNLKV